MNMLEAVATWYACPHGLLHCRENECGAYLFVDPRPESSRGTGPGTTGQRTLCSLLNDLDEQIMGKTADSRLK